MIISSPTPYRLNCYKQIQSHCKNTCFSSYLKAQQNFFTPNRYQNRISLFGK